MLDLWSEAMYDDDPGDGLVESSVSAGCFVIGLFVYI